MKSTHPFNKGTNMCLTIQCKTKGNIKELNLITILYVGFNKIRFTKFSKIIIIIPLIANKDQVVFTVQEDLPNM